jgi:5-methyltetrahydropteroyltriglutamate--homocysteine methyltransferase
VYRADHVGSLLRPPRLLEARQLYGEGRLSERELRDCEDGSILQVLDLQRQTGIGVVSDGEYRRGRFHEAWDHALEPSLTTPPQPVDVNPWKGRYAEIAHLTATEVGAVRRVVCRPIDVKRTKRMTGHEASFLKQHAPDALYKVTLPGPGYILGSIFPVGFSAQCGYRSREELARDLIAIARREVVALIDEGVPYIQLDSLRYTLQLADPRRRQALIDASIDPEQDLDLTIATDNACLHGIDRKASVIGLHMCRGNNRSAWIAEGHYDAVADKVFSQLRVDRLLLEYDDMGRTGGFEALRFVPAETFVVLGLISSKVPAMEDVDMVLRRIEEAAKYHPLEHLAVSPQCGFASTAPGNMLTWDDQRRKLELVAEVARRVWE